MPKNIKSDTSYNYIRFNEDGDNLTIEQQKDIANHYADFIKSVTFPGYETNQSFNIDDFLAAISSPSLYAMMTSSYVIVDYEKIFNDLFKNQELNSKDIIKKLNNDFENIQKDMKKHIENNYADNTDIFSNNHHLSDDSNNTYIDYIKDKKTSMSVIRQNLYNYAKLRNIVTLFYNVSSTEMEFIRKLQAVIYHVRFKNMVKTQSTIIDFDKIAHDFLNKNYSELKKLPTEYDLTCSNENDWFMDNYYKNEREQ